MKPIVGAIPGCHWEKLVPLLQLYGWSDQRSLDPEDWYRGGNVSHALSSSERFVLFHARPEVIVADAMSATADAADSLREWEACTLDLLDFYKRNRSQCVLLEVGVALRSPQKFLDILSKHFGVETPKCNCQPLPMCEVDPECQLLSNQFVAQSRLTSGLLSEAEACTTPLGCKNFTVPSVDVMELHEKYQSRRITRMEKVGFVETLCQENKILISQLYYIQEELHAYYSERKEYVARNKKLKRRLETREKANKTLKGKLNKSGHRIRRAEKAVHSVKNSTSWKLTAPVRAVKTMFFRKKAGDISES